MEQGVSVTDFYVTGGTVGVVLTLIGMFWQFALAPMIRRDREQIDQLHKRDESYQELIRDLSSTMKNLSADQATMATALSKLARNMERMVGEVDGKGAPWRWPDISRGGS